MHLHLRRLLGLSAVLALLSMPLTAGPSQASSTDRLLDHPLHGQAALDALGSRVGDAARLNRMSSTKLHTILSTDPTAWLGRDGRLYYVEEAASPEAIAAAPTTTAADAPYPLDQTFTLHSLPGSQHTIYLDFGAYTLAAGGFWATQGNMTPGTFSGFSMDSDPAFNDTEKALIQQVWQIVAEKYAPFDVDVTTQDPGAAAYNRNGPGDPTYGDHVVFTGDTSAQSQACGGSCSGVAVVGGFDDPNDNSDALEPAWVFTSTTYNSAALMAHTAAHEIGHTFGLSHDGVIGGSAYYSGQGNWFPLMGSGVNAVGQFSKGEYPLANNTEDDLAIIAGHGAPLRPDDYGNSTASPTDLGALSAYAVNGVIGTATDQDVFEVTRGCVGDLTASATGIGEGQAVDLKVSILDSGSSTLTSDDPVSGQDSSWPHKPTGMDASATVANASAGNYFVTVDGVGNGSPLSGGYSDYASIGNYHLTITGCPGAGGQPPSAPTALTATPTAHTTTGSLSWSAPSSAGDSPVSGYRITGLPGGTVDVPASPTSSPATGLVPGTPYVVGVAALNLYGAGPAATTTLTVPTWAPTSPPGLNVTVSGTTATASWSAPANPGHATITGWTLRALSGSTVLLTGSAPAGSQQATFSGFTPGTYAIQVTPQVSADDTSGVATATKAFTVAGRPSAPRIGIASSGIAGRPVNAIARWAAPVSNGGTAITGYRVLASKLNSAGQVVRRYASAMLGSSRRSFVFALPAGRYRFRVVAYNRVGASPSSAYSRIVSAR